jgi:hypothetical protein
MIRAEQIQQIEAKRRRHLKDTYRHILDMFTKKIKMCVSLGIREAHLDVPEFILGYPIYNHYSAVVYLKRQLELSGYTVYMSGSTLVVRWGKQKLKEEKVQEEPIDEETLPNLMNLRKMASKIIQDDRNGGHRRST